MAKERTVEEIIEAFRFLDVSEQIDLYNEYADKVGLPSIRYLSRENFERVYGSAYDFMDEILNSEDYDTDTYTHYRNGFGMTPYFATTEKATLTLIDKDYVEDFIFDNVTDDEFAIFVYDRYGNALDFDDDYEISEEQPMRAYLRDTMLNSSNTIAGEVRKGDFVIIDEKWFTSDYDSPEWQIARYIKDNGDGTSNILFCKDNEYVMIDNEYILGKADNEIADTGKRLLENQDL